MLKCSLLRPALNSIAALVRGRAPGSRTIACPNVGGGMHPNGDCRSAPTGVKPKPNKGERLSFEAVARALRRLFFAIEILLGLAFALVCYAGMFGIVQFDTAPV
jgi:hypothetical protein